MIEFKPEDYILDNTKFMGYYKSSLESREEVLTQAFDMYLQHQHGYTLACLLDLQSRMHNVRLKHFYAHEDVQDKKTHYTFKDKLIFTIYFDNMTWKCDIYY